MKPLKNGRRGSELLEFTLVGLPIIFIGISIFESALAMYQYQSMTVAVSVAARYAANHGAGCESPNTCTVTIGNIASLIAANSPIITPSTMNVSFTDNSGTTTCTLDVCETKTAVFPSSTGNANVAGNPITISVNHTVTNPLPIFWPSTAGTDDTGYTLGANSVQVIQF